MTPIEDIATWRRELEAVIGRGRIGSINRVVVVPETASTQDAAFELAGGRPGLLYLADRQLAGRARLGRPWVQGGNLGVAATFVIDAAILPAERLSLAAGVATALAIEAAIASVTLAGAPPPRLGLRWPNDVVERPADGGGRKLAGVLIEIRAGLALVGIGINVHHTAEDFPADLRGRAVSIAGLPVRRAGGRAVSRLNVVCELVRTLDGALKGGDVLSEWRKRDVLIGTRRTFLYEGRAYSGRVTDIDPLSVITVESLEGSCVHLPALGTSMVHE